MGVEPEKEIEELRARVERLEENQRRNSYLLAALSQELREPLNSVIGFSRILLRQAKGKLDARQYKNLEFVHESGKQANELLVEVDGLGVDLDPEPKDFDAVPLLRGLLAESGCEVELDSPDELLMCSQPSRLRALVGDLLERTRDQHLSRFRLSTNPAGDEFKLNLVWGEDEAEDELARIGRLLEQAKTGTTQATLNLAVAKRMARPMGGRLESLGDSVTLSGPLKL